MMECHPMRHELSRHGCSSSNKIDMAFQLYVYLCEDMKVWDISHHYSPDLDLIYILAKREKDSGIETFVPINMNSDVTLQFMYAVQNELGKKQDDGLLNNVKLAFVGSDSTILIHEMTQDIASFKPRRRKVADAATVLASTIYQHVKDNSEQAME